MAATGPPAFTGRTRERLELDGALDRVRGGESAVLVIRGEAGVGKTALLRYVADQAAGCRIAQIAGVESELELPFAALHQLCGPMLGDLEALPEPQEQALQVAFGMRSGNAPDRFVVGLGVLSMMAEVAAKRPLVCLVDDAQWLDEATRQVLGVAARRLLAESVMLLLAVRETGEERLFAGLPDLTVAGLPADEAWGLLAAATPRHLDERVRDRLVAETGGNPLALLELVGGMSEAELAGGFAASSAAPVSDHLHEHYLARVRALPDATRQLMLLAAADPTGDSTLLWRAAQKVGLGREAAEPAETGQLLEIGPSVQFRHPLVRSAAYAAGSPDERRAVHGALAEVTDPETDPDRRVWHVAAATAGRDDEVAAELERSADRAHARAGVAAAAVFLQRASALTSDPSARADRALGAAHAYLHAGSYDVALGLLAEADADAVDDLQRARIEQLRGEINRAATAGGEAPALLVQAARRLESLDARFARDAYLDAWGAALVAGPLATPDGHLEDVSVAARAAPPAPGERRPQDLLLDGLVSLVLDPPSQATPRLRDAVDSFLGSTLTDDEWLHCGGLAANAALALWDYDSWSAVSARFVEVARGCSALAPLVGALNLRRVVALWAGDVEAAEALGVEEEVAKGVTGTRRAPYGDLFLTAYQGRPETALPLIAAMAEEALARGEGLGVYMANRADALLHLGLGQYSEAAAAAQRAASGTLGPFTGQALPDLVEAAARAGDDDLAADTLRRLQEVTAVEGSDWASGLAARGRALVSSGADAERAHVESVERLARTVLRPELARTRLLYGEWLRREGRRMDAREQLRAAYDVFVAMGAEGFAERTRHELLATGEKVRKRQVDTLDELTPQEEHIARMARDGRTNPEIAAELFISPRTVEWHLRKVFGKLGITSRKGLHDALPTRSRYPTVEEAGR
ncbi:MAG TPA: AAA family ATPase [Nocardioides sp.]|nr:AAA family ATPase [Nocardioides sp.]